MPVSILISDDLPTFDRPIKAYSGKFGFGHCSIFELLVVNVAECITIALFLIANSWVCLLGFAVGKFTTKVWLDVIKKLSIKIGLRIVCVMQLCFFCIVSLLSFWQHIPRL